MPEPALASGTLTLSIVSSTLYNPVIKRAVSILVKNCPYFLRSFFGILSINFHSNPARSKTVRNIFTFFFQYTVSDKFPHIFHNEDNGSD